MNFYRPMTAADSAPPPGAQHAADPYQAQPAAEPYQSYTNVSGYATVSESYLPLAMPSMMQIEGPREPPVQIQRSSAPRASRNAPPPAFPGSMPPAGNQQVAKYMALCRGPLPRSCILSSSMPDKISQLRQPPKSPVQAQMQTVPSQQMGANMGANPVYSPRTNVVSPPQVGYSSVHRFPFLHFRF